MPREEVGVSILGSFGAFGTWSAINSSVWTIGTFCDTPEKIKEARQAMALGLGAILVLAAGLAMLYGKKGHIPSLVTASTGVGLYALYEYKLRKKEQSLKTAVSAISNALDGIFEPLEVF